MGGVERIEPHFFCRGEVFEGGGGGDAEVDGDG